MASETDHTLAHCEEVEKKVESEVKKVEAEILSASKEGLENPKAEESPCLNESGTKAEEKQVEPTLVEEVKVADGDEKPKVEHEAEPTVVKVEDKPVAVEPLVVKEQTKTEATSLATPSGNETEGKLNEPLAEEKVEDKPVAAKPEVVEEPKKADASSLAEPTGDKIEDKLVEPLAEEKIEDKPVAGECVVADEPTQTEAAPLAEPAGDKIEYKLVEPSTAEKIKDKPVAVECVVAEEPTQSEDVPLAEPAGEKIEDKLVEPMSVEAEVVEEPTKADALLAEYTGDKIEDKLVEPLAEEMIEDKAVELPPVVEQKNAEVVELIEKKIENKAVEPQADEKKIESVHVVECTDKGIPEFVNEDIIEQDTVSVSDSIVEKVGTKAEEKSALEQTENPVEESKPLPVEEKHVDLERCIVPESSLAKEVIDEKAEEFPAKGVEVIDEKEAPTLVADCKPEVVDNIVKDPPESALVEKEKSQKMTGEVKIANEEKTNAAKSLDQVESKIPPEEKDVECNQDEVKEPLEEKVVKLENVEKTQEEVKEPLEKKVVELENVEKTQEVSPVNEAYVECEVRNPTEDAAPAAISIPPPEAVEKAAAEVTCREVEPPMENGKRDQAFGSTEIANEVVEVKNDVVVAEELEKTEAAEREEEAVQAAECNLEEEKQVDKILEESVQEPEANAEEGKKPDEPGKTDVQNTEETKTAPKEDIPVKTQKTSIVKMMKQSLVKAKKAIIGKSQNSKTVASEVKDDGNK